MNINELKDLIRDKEKVLKGIKEEILELKRNLLSLKTGIVEGDIITDGKNKGIACYNGNDTMFWGVKKIKKDGSPSEFIQSACDWTKLQ